MAKFTKRKNLVARTHKTLRGATQLTGITIIGGDFTVEGDLRARSPILCMGRITVHGDVKAGVVVAGCGLDVRGDLVATELKLYGGRFNAGIDFDEVAREILTRLPKRWKMDDDLLMDHQLLVDEETLGELVGFEYAGQNALDVKGSCTCGTVFAGAPVHVGGPLIAQEIDAFGSSVSAQGVTVYGSLICGSIDALKRVFIGEDLDCVDADCPQLEVCGKADVQGTLLVTGADSLISDDHDGWIASTPAEFVEAGHDPLENVAPEEVRPSLVCGRLKAGSVTAAGSIRVYESIDCTFYLRAHRSILAGGVIETGKQHGIMAGIGVPRNLWLKTGYVCAAEKPKRVPTGVFRPLGRSRAGRVPKPAGLPRARG